MSTSSPPISPVTKTGAISSVSYWQLTREASLGWIEDHATRLAASLAFYTMLSLAPMLVLAIKGVGMIFSEEAANTQVRSYLRSVMGSAAADTINQMLGPLSRPGSGTLATFISVVVLIVSASGVFGELQDSLNTIWEVKPKAGRVLLTIIHDRFLSFGLVLGVCFLLLVSLVVSTALSSLTEHLGDKSAFWHVLNFVISIVIETVLFAMIFKFLPDADVRWSDVWAGAVSTGVLFALGKFVLGWYLGRATTTSIYGAAGSLIAILLWVYYSAQILFFGAEVTQSHAKLTRAHVAPTENAVNVT